jgi:hypothetical protein
LPERSERAPQQPNHAKRRLARVEAGVATGKVAGGELPALDLEEAAGEGPIECLGLAQGFVGKGAEGREERPGVGPRVVEAGLRQIAAGRRRRARRRRWR